MVQLSDLTWPAVEALPRSTPVVIPVAALEQHGGHMPVFTDSLLLGEVVRRASSALEGQALFAPLMWLGNSHHHMDFPGTLSASPRVYLDLLVDLMENFLFHGFRRIILLNGHGGNITPGKQAVFEVRQKYRQRTDLLLLFSTYWETADPCEGRTDLVQTSMGHACEWETSMILRLAPHLVGPIDGLEPVSPSYSFEPAYRGWTTKDRTKLGYIGDPRRATAEKGEHLFEVFTHGVVRHVRDIAGWDGHTWFPPEKA